MSRGKTHMSALPHKDMSELEQEKIEARKKLLAMPPEEAQELVNQS